MEEERFESLLFEGILCMIFQHIYALPIKKNIFSSALINKRWNQLFQHPLHTFFLGRFNSDLKRFPPAYYTVTEYRSPPFYSYIRRDTVWLKISSCLGMTRQIMNTDDGDTEREEFICKELYLYSFLHISVRSRAIRDLIGKGNNTSITAVPASAYVPIPRGVSGGSPRKNYRPYSGGSLCKIDSHEEPLYIEWYSKGIYTSDNKLLVSFDDSWHTGPISDSLPELTKEKINKFRVQDRPDDIFSLAEVERTTELYEVFLQHEPRSLLRVPRHQVTERMCQYSVQHGGAFHYIPEEYKTKELYELGVKADGLMLKHVPDQFITRELCEMAIRSGGSLSHVRSEFYTADLYKALVSVDGRSLEQVPYDSRTEEICTAAVQQNGNALEYAPQQLITYELCALAVKSNGGALNYFPEAHKARDLCTLAVIQSGLAIQWVPKPLITEEMCLDAVKQNGCALKHCPEAMITQRVCNYAIQQTPLAFPQVPTRFISTEILQSICRRGLLYLLPRDMVTSQLEEEYEFRDVRDIHSSRREIRDRILSRLLAEATHPS